MDPGTATQDNTAKREASPSASASIKIESVATPEDGTLAEDAKDVGRVESTVPSSV